MGRADFLRGQGNAEALALIDRWPLWPERGVFLAGPVGSGKSHLVAIWQSASDALVVPARQLDLLGLESHRAVAVEDLHAGPVDETALFHLLNLAAERDVALLFTSRVWPAGLSLRLPDLHSRLRAMQPVEIGEPEEDLLRRVLTKLFADRQVAVDPGVIDYIVMRMERSLAVAAALVERLDQLSLAAGSAVTKHLAGLVIAEMVDRQPDFWPAD